MKSLVCALTLALVALAAPAAAAPAVVGPEGTGSSEPQQLPVISTTTFDRAFAKTATYGRSRIKRCATIKVAGRIKGTRETYRHGSGFANRWKKVRIVHPRAIVVTREYLSHPTGFTCGDRLRTKRITIRHQWRASGCSVTVTGVSVSYPWGVSLTFGCTDSAKATKRTSGHSKSSRARQFNSDTVIRYGTRTCGTQCSFTAQTQVRARLTVKTPQGDDSDSATLPRGITLPG